MASIGCVACSKEFTKDDEILKSRCCGKIFHINCRMCVIGSYHCCPECNSIFHSRMSLEETVTNLEEKISKLKTDCAENPELSMLEAKKLELPKDFETLQKQLVEKDLLIKELKEQNEQLLKYIKELEMKTDHNITSQVLQEQSPIRNNENALDRCIVIRGLDDQKFANDDSLKKSLFEIFKLLVIDFTENDIEEVYIRTEAELSIKRNQIPKAPVLVQFKTIDLKLKILENCQILRQSNSSLVLSFAQYVSLETKILYQSAVSLQSYNNHYYVYCEGKKVYLRKNCGSKVLIENTKQADKMVQSHYNINYSILKLQ